MKDLFSVNDVVTILGKNEETIRRYIRAGIKSQVKLDEEIAKGKKNKINIAIDNNIDNLRGSSKAIALCVKDPNAKVYEITKESLIILLQRKLNLPSEKAAEDFLQRRLWETNIENVTPLQSINHDNCPICNSPYKSEPVHSEDNELLFIIPPSNHLANIIITEKDKELFMKGLCLLSSIDDDIAASEIIFINNRAELLNFDKTNVSLWIEKLKSLDIQSKDKIKSQLIFDSYVKAITFLTEGILLAWQDRDYQIIERELLLEIAKINDIDETNFSFLEEPAKEKYTKTIKNILFGVQ